MATKTLITRIQNKADTYANWSSAAGKLLDGEIAIVRVPTGGTYTNPVTGKSEPVVELLMKVGQKDSSGNLIAFNDLPWLSAKASDVYDWAKTQDPSSITVSYTKDDQTESATLAKVLEDLRAAETDIGTLSAAMSDVRSVISVDPSSATTNGVVQGITYNSTTGKFTVTYGTVATADIANSAITTAKIADSNVTTAKIADDNVTTAKIKDGNITTDKINDGAVTNAKLGADISTDKINVGTGTTSGTLSAKITAMDAEIAKKGTSNLTLGTTSTTAAKGNHNHDSVYIKPADVDTKINTALGSVLKYKGTKANTGALPTSGNATGDVWNITSACKESGTLPAVNAGDNVAWNGTGWDVLAGTVDLSSYCTEARVNSLLEEKAGTDHSHGNITNSGEITSTDVTDATGILVYDSSNKIQRATAAQTRTIIGAGTSNLALGTTATTAAKGNHTHSSYETRMGDIESDVAAIENNYIKVTSDQMYLGSDIIIFDCGGAPTA